MNWLSQAAYLVLLAAEEAYPAPPSRDYWWSCFSLLLSVVMIFLQALTVYMLGRICILLRRQTITPMQSSLSLQPNCTSGHIVQMADFFRCSLPYTLVEQNL